jgi:hypothetical protein
MRRAGNVSNVLTNCVGLLGGVAFSFLAASSPSDLRR